jgi:hypothetical protein
MCTEVASKLGGKIEDRFSEWAAECIRRRCPYSNPVVVYGCDCLNGYKFTDASFLERGFSVQMGSGLEAGSNGHEIVRAFEGVGSEHFYPGGNHCVYFIVCYLQGGGMSLL